MSNNYFQFKQFTIRQDRCAMKVSTDACIQGAWTPIAADVRSVLDIGAGTGLLALMLAQRNEDIHIDAIELDEQAAQQAKENVDSSPWAARIQVMKEDIRNYKPACKYDMVICNPPFFQNSLLGEELPRNMARHTLSLSYSDLVDAFENFLNANAYAAVLLPSTEHEIWETLLEKRGWQVFRKLIIKHRGNGKPTRVLSLCHKTLNGTQEIETLIIKDEQEQYTTDFVALLRPYYLKL